MQLAHLPDPGRITKNYPEPKYLKGLGIKLKSGDKFKKIRTI